MDVFFSDAKFMEVLVWGGFFLFAIILLFLLAQFLKRGIASNIRSRTIPFAMTMQDVEKMRAAGQLSDEEAKVLKATMSKKIVERVQAEAEKRKMPPKAELALAGAAEAPPPPAPMQARPAAAAPAPAGPAVPDRIARFAAMPDFELDQMVDSGFLSAEDRALIARAKGTP